GGRAAECRRTHRGRSSDLGPGRPPRQASPMVILLLTVGVALIALLALVVTAVDVARAPARRALAAERRGAWERGSEQAVAGSR
ncbi:MAG: hypothetical protein L0K86_25075, partial [Actinomycetia bacterium]|nr:hypothetical protein [Actinomycetes bacterium]